MYIHEIVKKVAYKNIMFILIIQIVQLSWIFLLLRLPEGETAIEEGSAEVRDCCYFSIINEVYSQV